jgi:hypothetical protein
MENKFNRHELEEDLVYLQNEYCDTIQLMEEIYQYHPKNPNFINPISLYEKLKGSLLELECKINEIELKINSIN